MRRPLLFLLLLSIPIHAAEFDEKAAERFANLALACVNKEYPNKISHNLNSDKDVAAPRKLTPAFYGVEIVRDLVRILLVHARSQLRQRRRRAAQADAGDVFVG